MEISLSNRPTKRFKASFLNGKHVHFGQKDGSTYIDHNDNEKKNNYISRHKVNEDWTDPQAPGTLSRYLLWEHKTLERAMKDYKERFNLPFAIINV